MEEDQQNQVIPEDIQRFSDFFIYLIEIDNSSDEESQDD